MIILNRVKDTSEISDFWGSFAQHLLKGIEDHGLVKFLQWGFIKTCMVHEIKASAMKKLKKNIPLHLFKDIVKEDKFGSPKNNKNLLHHLYSLMEFGLSKLDGMGTIYEFGGGYGGMCKLIYRLGFKGIYVIRDLPIMSYLQKEYLNTIGMKNITDINTDHYAPSVDLFIAMWSLSECPLKARDSIIKKITTDHYLIAFQNKFHGYNNLKYFKQLIKSKHDFKWNLYEMKHLPNNYYLFGDKK